tara:strand:+ start:1001 stop:1444 length:444 start_codon:yes stop_codon:yes gene_type:complete
MKIDLLIERDIYTEKSTSGKLYFNGEFLCYTGEMSWLENKQSISCIPLGVYFCRIRKAEESASRKYDHLLVKDVPGRSYILVHIGNYLNSQDLSSSDSRGCILPGMNRKKDFVGDSTTAQNLLMKRVHEIKEKEDEELVIQLIIKKK